VLPELPRLSDQPLISAIIPTYNAARFLPDAIASIRGQEYPNLEIIVVDDGSTDDTPRAIASLSGIRYLRQANRGPAAARNAGIGASRGELLAFLDADDLWTPDHLSVLLAPLVADPQARFSWGWTKWVWCEEHSGEFCERQVQYEDYPLCLIPAGLFRREAFAETGLFAEGMLMAEDTDWVAGARFRQLKDVQVPRTVLIYRRHAGSLTAGQPVPQRFVFSMLQRSLARHRRQTPPASVA